MKKVYLLGTIVAATVAQAALAEVPGAVAVAPATPGCPQAFKGFHLGGNIGVGFINAKQNFTRASKAATPGAAFVTNSHVSNRLGGTSVDGGVGVGYTHRFCNFAVGLNFDANWAGTDGQNRETIPGTTTTASAKGTLRGRLKNSLQLYARMGYVMREIAMPYIGLGWDNSQWRHSAQLVRGATPAGTAPAVAQLSRSVGKNKRFNAFLWKVGVDFLATKHVVVGFEYTGTDAGKKHFKKDFTNADGSVERFTSNFKPQYNKFAVTAKIVY